MLVLTLSTETLEYGHSQLLKLGEHLWQDYYLLRVDPAEPDCRLAVDIDQALAKLRQQHNAAAAEEDLLGLFDPEPFNAAAARRSLEERLQLCVIEHERVAQLDDRITPPVVLFRGFEHAVAATSGWLTERQRVFLLCMLLLAALCATLSGHHIAFRPILSRLDQRVSHTMQLIGHLLLCLSVIHHNRLLQDSGATEHVQEHLLMLAGFVALTLVNLISLLRAVSAPADTSSPHSPLHTLLRASLTVPLYSYMALVAGGYFFLAEGHPSGLVIFIGQILEQSELFLKVGLFIWIGMILKETQLGERVFSLFRPFQLTPEMLAVLAVMIMALPTAFTGASGVIIIALGAVIYQELRKAGARRQLALAATAMSGSTGVVLRPCLLIVLIAALNKEVVTDQLYDWGAKVFLLNALLFMGLMWLLKTGAHQTLQWRGTLAPVIKSLQQLLPYVVIFVVVTLFYALVFEAQLDEFSAPIILPVIVLLMLLYEGGSRRTLNETSAQLEPQFEPRVRRATAQSALHTGALLMLMSLSFALGGVIERAELLAFVPTDLDSVWLTVSLLLLVLVMIGMVMEPFGAVVLVTGTLASVAYANGMDPIHFWVMTLVAFELGYLSPPVALNHLLTRQVVGEQEAQRAVEVKGAFWYRYERLLLPIVVVGTTLLLVAYVPLFFY